MADINSFVNGAAQAEVAVASGANRPTIVFPKKFATYPGIIFGNVFVNLLGCYRADARTSLWFISDANPFDALNVTDPEVKKAIWECVNRAYPPKDNSTNLIIYINWNRLNEIIEIAPDADEHNENPILKLLNRTHGTAIEAFVMNPPADNPEAAAAAKAMFLSHSFLYFNKFFATISRLLTPPVTPSLRQLKDTILFSQRDYNLEVKPEYHVSSVKNGIELNSARTNFYYTNYSDTGSFVFVLYVSTYIDFETKRLVTKYQFMREGDNFADVNAVHELRHSLQMLD
jgi:hypothetical protein